MVTFQAKVKIDGVVHVIDWDASNKVSIPSTLEAAVTSPELVRLMNALRSLRLWMDSSLKQEIRLERAE